MDRSDDNGEIFTDKPILYFWLVLIASKTVGVVNEWRVRLPVAVACVGLVCTTYLDPTERYLLD
jgi:4-amino-4-deoxy-L-arabinose transferase-like glycosyltransferase